MAWPGLAFFGKRPGCDAVERVNDTVSVWKKGEERDGIAGWTGVDVELAVMIF